jgi:hypothetical protein
MNAPIRYLSPGDDPLPSALEHDGVAIMAQAALEQPGTLRDAGAVLIPRHADQRLLDSVRPVLEHFLVTGGTIVVCGEIHHPFLPDLRPFEPLALTSTTDLTERPTTRSGRGSSPTTLPFATAWPASTAGVRTLRRAVPRS